MCVSLLSLFHHHAIAFLPSSLWMCYRICKQCNEAVCRIGTPNGPWMYRNKDNGYHFSPAPALPFNDSEPCPHSLYSRDSQASQFKLQRYQHAGLTGHCEGQQYKYCSGEGGMRWRYKSGDRIPVEARFSAPVQTGPGAHPASCTMGTGSFKGVNPQGRGVDHQPHLALKLKKE
jgi:hypothetical protein